MSAGRPVWAKGRLSPRRDGHGGGQLPFRGQRARPGAGRRPLLSRCARPARPPPPIHSRERLDAQPAPERLAPTTVLTLPRTLRACSGRFPGSTWGQSDFLAAKPRSPPLQARQLPRVDSARSRRPPQVPVAFWSGLAGKPEHLRHPQHCWQREPPAVFDLSGCICVPRAHRLSHASYNPTCTHMYIRRFTSRQVVLKIG